MVRPMNVKWGLRAFFSYIPSARYAPVVFYEPLFVKGQKAPWLDKYSGSMLQRCITETIYKCTVIGITWTLSRLFHIFLHPILTTALGSQSKIYWFNAQKMDILGEEHVSNPIMVYKNAIMNQSKSTWRTIRSSYFRDLWRFICFPFRLWSPTLKSITINRGLQSTSRWLWLLFIILL